MSRLNEAFEKAAGGRSGKQAEKAHASPHADATALVPDVWDFDLSRDAPQVEPDAYDHLDNDDVAQPLQSAASQRAESRTDDANRERAADVWSEYRFGAEAQAKVVVGPQANSALVEQYRRLGAALHHHQLQGAAHTLMVTSAVASEGKTLTATNLALTLSHSYKRRVLLIDADLRRPSVHDVL